MALLNFAGTYAEIMSLLDVNTVGSNDYYKLFFTKDGHIHTHGVDFTLLFSVNNRGTVPAPQSASPSLFLNANKEWSTIPIESLPTTTTITVASTHNELPTASSVVNYVTLAINNGFAANDAMVFKGTLGGTVLSLPTTYLAGYTYKVATEGTYAGLYCTVGDMIIAVVDSTDASAKESENWTVVQNNLYSLDYVVNGGIYKLNNAVNIGTPFTIYAPTTPGDTDLVLIGSSSPQSSPTWCNLSLLSVGDSAKVGGLLPKELLTEVGFTEEGMVYVTVGGTKIISRDWIGKFVGTSQGTAGILTAGSGLTINGTGGYNGSDNRTISLVSATNTSIGGIKPWMSRTVSSTYNGSSTAPSSDNTVVSVNAITSALGRYYAVEIDSEGRAFVNVPWGNDEYGLATKTSNGLVPKYDTLQGVISNQTSSWILTYDNATDKYGWFNLPESAFKGREIQINGNSIGDQTLNIMPSESVALATDTNDGTVEISFRLAWYNISSNEYEVVTE